MAIVTALIEGDHYPVKTNGKSTHTIYGRTWYAIGASPNDLVERLTLRLITKEGE